MIGLISVVVLGKVRSDETATSMHNYSIKHNIEPKRVDGPEYCGTKFVLSVRRATR